MKNVILLAIFLVISTPIFSAENGKKSEKETLNYEKAKWAGATGILSVAALETAINGKWSTLSSLKITDLMKTKSPIRTLGYIALAVVSYNKYKEVSKKS